MNKLGNYFELVIMGGQVWGGFFLFHHKRRGFELNLPNLG
jgi:hypothetical protein